MDVILKGKMYILLKAFTKIIWWNTVSLQYTGLWNSQQNCSICCFQKLHNISRNLSVQNDDWVEQNTYPCSGPVFDSRCQLYFVESDLGLPDNKGNF